MDQTQVKLFNKNYIQMQQAVRASLKRRNDKIYNVKSIDQINNFKGEIDNNIELYNAKNPDLFDAVFLLKRVFFGKPKLSEANNNVAFGYIALLYSTVKKEVAVPTTSVVKSESGIDGIIKGLMSNPNSGINDMIADISAQVAESSKGKQIDEQQIIRDLLQGNMNSSGIDFKSIIENSSKKLQEKISNNEIDVNVIKQAGDDIHKIFPHLNK